MLLSIALILLVGMALSGLCQRLRLPGLVGMLATGILLGPYGLNWIDASILAISAEIRKIALIVILTRAGLRLDLAGLRRLGRPALLMCFVPACLEILGVVWLAPGLLGLARLEAALLGAVLAAVSPAVVVPRMVRLMDEGYGTRQGVPQMILAGASVDDVVVIVLFTTFLGMLRGSDVSAVRFVNVPVSVALGAVLGLLSGAALSTLFARWHLRDTVKILLMLCLSFLLVAAEDTLKTPITFSALIAILTMGVPIQRHRTQVAARLGARYDKLWVAAEVFLFVLVGATVDLRVLGMVGGRATGLIAGGILFRMLGVLLCLLGTELSRRERLFAMIAYTPKATVQAAIGGVALGMGLPCGALVLSVAVLSIVLSAPLGAFAIDGSYRKLLRRADES